MAKENESLSGRSLRAKRAIDRRDNLVIGRPCLQVGFCVVDAGGSEQRRSAVGHKTCPADENKKHSRSHGDTVSLQPTPLGAMKYPGCCAREGYWKKRKQEAVQA